MHPLFGALSHDAAPNIRNLPTGSLYQRSLWGGRTVTLVWLITLVCPITHSSCRCAHRPHLLGWTHVLRFACIRSSSVRCCTQLHPVAGRPPLPPPPPPSSIHHNTHPTPTLYTSHPRRSSPAILTVHLRVCQSISNRNYGFAAFRSCASSSKAEPGDSFGYVSYNEAWCQVTHVWHPLGGRPAIKQCMSTNT